jgi:hypothetical protein
MEIIMQLTATEKRILQNIHWLGHTGKCGSLNLKQRRALLHGLVEKGLLTPDMTLTKLGVEVSAPFYNELEPMHDQDARMPTPIRAMLYRA